MSVPKAVILDLLPAYLADEVSPATRAWVDEYLARDPDLAEQVRRHKSQAFSEPASPQIAPELEVRAFERTRRVLAQLRWLFALAMTFSATALSVEVSFRPFNIRPLLLDYPGVLVPFLTIGTICWIAYFRRRRKLRVIGA